MSRRRSRAQREFEAWEQEIAQRVAEREAEILQLEAERQVTEAEREVRVKDRLDRLRVDYEARKLHIAELTRSRTYDVSSGRSLEEFLAESDEAPEPVVGEADDALHYRGGNTLLVAEFKAGKTILAANLAAAIADGEDFLGRFPVNMSHGRVAFFNYEMSERQFREWMRQLEVENTDRILVQNLRGWQLPFWDQEQMLRLSEWLLGNEVGFVILDPAARAWRGLVEQEGDNIQLSEFFGALDELKRLGDVSNLLITAHRPRAKGEERARGGAEIEAWPDSNWYLNHEVRSGQRSLRAYGRDVELEAINIDWEDESSSRRLSAGAKADPAPANKVSDDEGIGRVLVAVNEAGGEVVGAERLKEAITGDRAKKAKWIELCIEQGLIDVETDGSTRVFRLNN